MAARIPLPLLLGLDSEAQALLASRFTDRPAAAYAFTGSGTLTVRPSAIQHGEGEHEEAPDQGRDHPGPGGHAVVARSGARDRGIQIRRPRDGLLAQGRSGAQQQGFAVVLPWW